MRRVSGFFFLLFRMSQMFFWFQQSGVFLFVSFWAAFRCMGMAVYGEGGHTCAYALETVQNGQLYHIQYYISK